LRKSTRAAATPVIEPACATTDGGHQVIARLGRSERARGKKRALLRKATTPGDSKKECCC
jgi:hypothetical protein